MFQKVKEKYCVYLSGLDFSQMLPSESRRPRMLWTCFVFSL